MVSPELPLSQEVVAYGVPRTPLMTRPPGLFGRSASMDVVYARHGRELMGCKSPVLESSHCRETE
jgi:hypothetical protein